MQRLLEAFWRIGRMYWINTENGWVLSRVWRTIVEVVTRWGGRVVECKCCVRSRKGRKSCLGRGSSCLYVSEGSWGKSGWSDAASMALIRIGWGLQSGFLNHKRALKFLPISCVLIGWFMGLRRPFLSHPWSCDLPPSRPPHCPLLLGISSFCHTIDANTFNLLSLMSWSSILSIIKTLFAIDSSLTRSTRSYCMRIESTELEMRLFLDATCCDSDFSFCQLRIPCALLLSNESFSRAKSLFDVCIPEYWCCGGLQLERIVGVVFACLAFWSHRDSSTVNINQHYASTTTFPVFDNMLFVCFHCLSVDSYTLWTIFLQK